MAPKTTLTLVLGEAAIAYGFSDGYLRRWNAGLLKTDLWKGLEEKSGLKRRNDDAGDCRMIYHLIFRRDKSIDTDTGGNSVQCKVRDIFRAPYWEKTVEELWSSGRVAARRHREDGEVGIAKASAPEVSPDSGTCTDLSRRVGFSLGKGVWVVWPVPAPAASADERMNSVSLDIFH